MPYPLVTPVPHRMGVAAAFPEVGWWPDQVGDQSEMTSVTVPGIDTAPTTNTSLLAWVSEVADLTTPDEVVWCDGSDAEWDLSLIHI